MRLIRLYLVVIFTLFIAVLAIAQVKGAQFDNGTYFTMANGMSSNSSSSIVEDAYGFIWIGGNNGVSRFDGSYFQNYEYVTSKAQNKKIGLVTSLFYDELNNILWIGAFSGLYYTSTDVIDIKEYDLNIQEKDGNARINSFVKDKNDGFWITGRLGLHYINLKNLNKHEIIYDTNNTLLNRSTVIKKDFIDDNILWIGSTKGLIKYNRLTNVHTHYFKDDENHEANQIRAMFVLKDDVYMGTWTSGLIKFSKKTETFTSLFNSEQLNSGNKTVKDLFHDGHQLWVTTTNGLIQYDVINERIINVLKNDYKKNLIRGIEFVDSRGIAWYGHSKALFKYQSKSLNEELVYLEDRSDFENPFVPERFIHFKESTYLVGYKSRGIYKIDADNLTFKIIEFPNNVYSEENLVDITDMVQMNDEMFLVLSDSKIFFYNASSEAIRLSALQVNSKDPTFQTVVKDTTNNTYWIGSRKEGLFHIDFENQSIEQFKDEFNADERDSFPWINYMYLDSQNKLWLARGSYTVMDLNDNTIYNLDKNLGFPYFQDVAGYVEDRFGRVWVAGMSKGLGFINFKDFSKGITHQFSGNFHGLYKLDENNFWTIGNGLGVLDTETLNHKKIKFQSSLNSDIIAGPIINIGDNTFLIGCENGFLKLNYNRDDKIINPKPYIREIVSEETNVYNLRLGSENFNLPKGTTNILAKISALSFNDPFRNSFEYKIKDQWLNVPENNEISIANIGPGTITIELRVKDLVDNLASKYKLSLFIPRPIWKTNIAYGIYIILLMLIIYWFYRFLLSRQLAISEINKLKEVDLLRSSLYTNITHEFRTPITVILGLVDLIKSKKDNNANDLGKSLMKIERNGQDLLKMVNHMLDLAKLESTQTKLNFIQADVVSFIKYLFESFETSAQIKSIKYTFYTEMDSLIMDYDTDKLASIITNLITNAIKFTPAKGSVLIILSKVKKSNSSYLVLKCVDTGIGISQEDMTVIFDKFYQVENSLSHHQVGSGLGLTLVNEFVQLMDGDISVKSEINYGSEFILELPITNKANLVSNLIRKHRPNKGDNKHIKNLPRDLSQLIINKTTPIVLIIEDNKDVAEYLKMCLREKYTVIYAENGEDGIEMATNYVPDIIISDVMMPKKDGIELCKVLKSEMITNHIPIILLTAKASHNDRMVGLSAGADAYLIKPFNKEELMIRIDQLVGLRKRMILKFRNKNFIELKSNEAHNPELLFINKVINCIEDELDNSNFGTSELAIKMYLSESQIYRKLKAITGQSTAIFIRSVRLNSAKTMLKSKDKTVSEVAYAVGFKDTSWFSRAYKKEFGHSPSESKNF